MTVAGSVLEVAVPRAALLSGDNAGMASFALVWNGTIAGALRLLPAWSLALGSVRELFCWLKGGTPSAPTQGLHCVPHNRVAIHLCLSHGHG